MPSIPELAHWTPVALNLNDPEPGIDWCDMRGERFTDPFFDHTVARLVNNGAGRPVVRTPLDALLELDAAPSLEPSGFVFHMGRCGSTLVGRLLGMLPGVVAVLEPRPINNLLEAYPTRLNEEAQIQILQLLVRALGRVRFGDERRLVLKLSSWNIRKAALFRRAFPEVPMVWVQRRPVEVMASMLKDPPAWLALRNHPAQAAHFFGVDPAVVTRVDGFEFAARLLASMLDAAAESDVCIIDYDDLPGAVADIVAPLFGIDINARDRAMLEEQARYHSKTAGAVPFTDDSERKRAVPDRVKDVSSSLLDERYSLLNTRRVEQRAH
jgi:hypothetical protein